MEGARDEGGGAQCVLVLADSDCYTALSGMDLENNEPTALPPSCQIASQVEIVETW